MKRLRTRLALIGVVLSAPAVLALLPVRWFDENAEGALDRKWEPPDRRPRSTQRAS